MPAEPRSPAWFEREYSPSSAAGGNYAPFIERYRGDSATARDTVANVRLAYGARDRETIEFFPAPTATSTALPRPPLLAYIHGGYWQEGSAIDATFLAPTWHDDGWAFAAIGYTLAPAATVGEIVDQCCTALTFLHRRADELGYDPARIVVAGSSAGAYLSMSCALLLDWISGAVLMSGVYDLRPLVGTSINTALGLDAATASELDVSAVRRAVCPTVVAWGGIETSEFKRQSNEMAAALRAAGTSVVDVEVADRNHFDIVHDLGDRDRELYRLARECFSRP